MYTWIVEGHLMSHVNAYVGCVGEVYVIMVEEHKLCVSVVVSDTV